MRDTGCLNYWSRVYVHKRNKCTDKKGARQNQLQPKLKVPDFYGAFILLFSGWLLAMIVFLFENARRPRDTFGLHGAISPRKIPTVETFN